MRCYFDRENGFLDPAAFSSQSLYRRELLTVFARSWLAIGPEDWLREPGDFLTTTMGETPVIAWCDDDGRVRLFFNHCPSGTGAISARVRGNAKQLTCPCHRRRYAPQVAAETHMLEPVRRVATFGGLIFGCFDDEAPDLVDSLGEMAWYWEAIGVAERGGAEIYGDAALRLRRRGNWKLPAETYCGDTYREQTLLRANRALLGDSFEESPDCGFQVSVGAGSMVFISSKESGAAADDPRARLKPVLGAIYPNLSYDGWTGAIHIWHPRGPFEFEAHSYCIVGRGETAEGKADRKRRWQLLFGGAGLEAGDQQAVWASIAKASRGALTRRTPFNLQMGLGRERSGNLPGSIADFASEANQRAFYDWWQARLEPSGPSCRQLPIEGRVEGLA